jgi:hypothetical protein
VPGRAGYKLLGGDPPGLIPGDLTCQLLWLLKKTSHKEYTPKQKLLRLQKRPVERASTHATAGSIVELLKVLFSVRSLSGLRTPSSALCYRWIIFKASWSTSSIPLV